MCEQVAHPALDVPPPPPMQIAAATGGSRSRGRSIAIGSERVPGRVVPGRVVPGCGVHVNVEELCGLARMLLDVDEDCVDTPEKHGWTPLMTAAEWACLPLVRLLLERGASVTAVDDELMTALHWSVLEEDRPAHADVICCLLEYHADPNALNGEGKTALQCAKDLCAAPAVMAALEGLTYDGLPRTREEVRCLERERRAAAQAEAAAEAAAVAGTPLHPITTKGGGKKPQYPPPKPKPAKATAVRELSAEQEPALEERRQRQLDLQEERERQQRQAEMDAATCQMCHSGQWEDGNQILFCDGDGCGVAVHQECYLLGSELPAGDWLCDACAPRQCIPSTPHEAAISCVLCHKTSRHPEGGRWQSFPLMRCQPPGSTPEGLIHAACADSLKSVYRDEEARAWRWDAAGEATIEKLRAISLKKRCHVCGQKGGFMVQCAHGSTNSGCIRVIHPLCAQQQRFVRFDSRHDDEVGAFCSWAHLPTAHFTDDDDPNIAAKGRVERHEELYAAVGLNADRLATLLASLHDRQKRRLSLRDMLTYLPSAAVTGAVRSSLRAFFGDSAAPPSLVHLLAVAGGVDEERRDTFHGRQATTTDGLTMVLCHAARTRAVAAAEAEQAAVAQAAVTGEATSPDMAGPVRCNERDEDDDEAADDDGGSSATSAAILGSRVTSAAIEADAFASVAAEDDDEAPIDDGLILRRCGPTCTAWGLGLGGSGMRGGLGNTAGLGKLLDCCEHSPFAAAVRAGMSHCRTRCPPCPSSLRPPLPSPPPPGRLHPDIVHDCVPTRALAASGFVERSLLLYHASCPVAHGTSALQASDSHSQQASESDVGGGASAGAGGAVRGSTSAAAIDLDDEDMQDVQTADVAACSLDAIARALFTHKMSVNMRQMLLLLAARAALPGAGSKEQLRAAHDACGESGWRPVTSTDVTDGSERRTTIELSGQADPTLLPPFVYVTENVMVDVTPQWATGAAHGGCHCCKRRGGAGGDGAPTHKRVCGEACRSKQQECGYACACYDSTVQCRNRQLQAGLVKTLTLNYWGTGKGWGVKAAEFIRQGDFVVEYVGEVISEQEMERRAEACDDAWQYVFTLDGKGGVKHRCYIDAHAVRNLAAFINFGCSPNLETRRVRSLSGDRRLARVAFYAKCDIKVGTELTYRRDPNAFSKGSRSEIQCRCGADKCMGFL